MNVIASILLQDGVTLVHSVKFQKVFENQGKCKKF